MAYKRQDVVKYLAFYCYIMSSPEIALQQKRKHYGKDRNKVR